MQIITIDPYNQRWALQYADEYRRLRGHLPSTSIEHIGSTAVPGMAAKPIIDIIVGCADQKDFDDGLRKIRHAGYVQEGQRAAHAWLCYPSPERRQFILHLVILGGKDWVERRAFRDYLRSRPTEAIAYADLKRQIAAQHPHDLDAYTKAKADFVASITKQTLQA